MDFLDEYLSLTISENFAPLLGAVRRAPPAADSARVESEIESLIRGEDNYRAASGYASVVDKATDSEALRDMLRSALRD